MKWLIWRSRAVLAFREKVPGMIWREAWDYAGTFGDSFREGMSPAEAVSEEISYWGKG
jgi:hypothetical protein